MLAKGWLRRPKATLLFAFALLVAGIRAGSGVPIEWVPTVELPAVTLAAAWPGASAGAVERRVTAPLERALQGIPGTAGIESFSSEGRSLLRVEVAERHRLGLYAAEVLDRVALLRGSLPKHVIPTLTHEVPESLQDEHGFMTLRTRGAISRSALRRIVEQTVAPRLRSLPGISSLTLDGGEEEELLISLAEDRLQAYGLTAGAVQQQLEDLFTHRSFGWLPAGDERLLLWKPGAESVDAVARLELPVPAVAGAAPLRLRDVARVALSPAPVRSLSRVDGEPVVTLTLDRAPGSHLLATSAAVRRALDDLEPQLPWRVEVLVADDRSEQVRRELRRLAIRGGAGLAVLCGVLMLMLRSAGGTLLVLFSAAVAMAGGLALLRPLGVTLNIVTLAGLALLVGFVVDNGAVVVERLLFEKSRCPRPDDASRVARRALQAVWLPLLGGTGTTIAIFLPMVYLSQELRSLFTPFAILVAATLCLSLFLAAFLVPVLGQWLAAPAPRGRRWRRARRWFQLPQQLAARFPGLALLLVVLAVGLPTPWLPEEVPEPRTGWASSKDRGFAERYNQTLGSDAVRSLRLWTDPLLGGVTRPFLDSLELGDRWQLDRRPEVTVWLRLPSGSGTDRTDELIRRFEQRALGRPSVHRTLIRVIEDVAVLRVLFKDHALELDEPFLLRRELIREAMQLAGVEVVVSGLVPKGFYSGLGNVLGMPVEMQGASYDRLSELADRLAHRLRGNPRIAGVELDVGRTGWSTPREVLNLRPVGDTALSSGRTASHLARTLAPHLVNHFPDFYADLAGTVPTPVRVLDANATERDVADLLRFPLTGKGEVPVPIQSFVQFTTRTEPANIERVDQRYRRHLYVYFRGPRDLGEETITGEIAAMPLPAGYTIELPSGVFLTEEVRAELVWLLLATGVLVFLLLAAVFESWRLPWIVMLTLPTALFGVAGGFLITGAEFAEGAFIGLALLLGLAVNNSILLVFRYRQLQVRRSQASPALLAQLAVRQRLRPMWTTTLSSVAGMLPLLISRDPGEFWLGLAVTVAFGLLGSTLLMPTATVALLSRVKG